MLLLVFGFICGIAAAYFIAQILEKRKPKFLSINEYWIYLPGTELPKQDAVLEKLFNLNRR